MLGKLAPELQSCIINNISHKKDLSSLALTCRRLKEEAQRALYHSPVIRIHPADHQYQIPFLETITSSPNRLTSIVRRLTVTVLVAHAFAYLRVRAERHRENVDYEKRALIGWIEDVGVKLRQALQRMHGITHLRFSYDGDDSLFRPTWLMSLLETCTFRLKALAWEVDDTDIALLITKTLEQQQELRVLKLNSVNPFDEGSETDRVLGHFCPQLHTISAPSPVIRAMLLHNRRIPYLEWRHDVFLGAFSTIVKQKFPHVKCIWGPETLKHLNVSISFFPNVVLLEIGFLSEEDYTPITSLPNLEVLILTSYKSDLDPDGTLISKRLLTKSANLNKVYYKSYPQRRDSDHPVYACHIYEHTLNEIKIRSVYKDDDEMNIWRGPAGLDFADINLVYAYRDPAPFF